MKKKYNPNNLSHNVPCDAKNREKRLFSHHNITALIKKNILRDSLLTTVWYCLYSWQIPKFSITEPWHKIRPPLNINKGYFTPI